MAKTPVAKYLPRRQKLADQLAKRIKARRTQLGWTQETLSQVADVTQPTITKLERGVPQLPTMETLVRLSIGLQIPLSELVADEDKAA